MNRIKPYILKSVYIFLVFLAPGILNSQNLKFKRLSIEEGLSAVSVNTIFQDSQEFIWIGTQDGLNRYDGYHIKTYKTGQDSKSSISSNFINCLYEDKNHQLYIGTEDGGMAVFNKQTELFTNYKNIPNKKSISSNSVRSIIELNANELLVATENGLNLFNVTTKQFELIKTRDTTEAANLKFIYKDSKGNIYVVSEGNGFFEYNKSNQSLIHYPIPDQFLKKIKSGSSNLDNMRCITEVAGSIWCGSDEGILVFDQEKKTFSKTIDFSGASKQNNRIVSFSVIKDSNYVWIGTWGGIIKYDINTSNYSISTNEASEQNSLSDNKVTYLYTDKQNNLWVATLEKGINIYFISSTKFPLWDSYAGLTNDFIYSILQTSDNTIWAGTAEGLYKKGLKDKKFTDATAIIKKHGATTVLSLLEDFDGKMWIGTFGQGIIIYDPKKKSSKVILGNSKLGGTIIKIVQTKTGAIWAGTYGDGLYVINPNTLSIKHFTTEQGLSSNKINAIFEDPKNSCIWLGTIGGGICILDFVTSTDKPIIKTFKHIEDKNSISSDNINHIYKDSKGIFWISTYVGLNKFDYAKKQFYAYTEKDGLLNSYIYSVLPDNEGNLWLPSNFGLTKFNPNISNENGVAFKNHNTKDGIQAREFNLGASYICKDGTMLIGGISGINYFNPKNIIESKIAPNTFIYSFSRQGKEIKQDTSILYIKDIKLKHKENYFTFEVVAVDYQSSEKNKFMYKLEGYDSEWSSPSDVRFVSYTELPGGEYTFKVKTNNSDGVWSEKPFELKITVIPPWWRTTWFYVLAIITSFALIIGFTSYRTRRIKKENKLLEIKVADRTKELEEKNKDITSSIEYAKRIQEAILPSQQLIFSKFKNAFILYKPKDIVSGDFYWFGEKNNYKIIAAVDCTGHGVPGAFMSMIGHNLLNQIVLEEGMFDPGMILTQLHKGVQTALKQGQNQINTSDGMDVSIAAINTETNECLWAGAFRNLLIISKGGELEKIEGTKHPIGGSQLDEKRIFKTNTRQLRKDDTIYLFSDGYADQFGGEKGKKLMLRSFQEHLISIRGLNAKEQKESIEERFNEWRGNFEQVDDVLVIGIKI